MADHAPDERSTDGIEQDPACCSGPDLNTRIATFFDRPTELLRGAPKVAVKELLRCWLQLGEEFLRVRKGRDHVGIIHVVCLKLVSIRHR